MNRKKLLEWAQNPEDRIVIAKILDKIQSSIKFAGAEVTDFYDPYRQNLLSPVLACEPGISFIWTGGYKEAERQRAIICPEYMDPGDADNGLLLLSITGKLRFQNLSHRDFLGAIIGLGIKREKIGDILVGGEGCQVIVSSDIGDYIVRNLTRVNRLGVRVEPVSLELLHRPEETTREVFATVASLRLDAVAAAGYGISRNKMVEEIKAEKVRVNWAMTTDCSYRVHVGDKISVKGKGRLEIDRMKGETKKGRVALIFKKY